MPSASAARATRWWGVCVIGGVLGATTSAPGHHAGYLQFDATKSITLTGIVTSLEWQFPHAGFTLDVTSPSGRSTRWDVVFEGPNNLVRRGWKKTTLKAGERVTLKGAPARDGSAVVSATSVTRQDGQSVVPSR